MADRDGQQRDVFRNYKFDRVFLHRFWLCLKIPFYSLLSDSSLIFILLLGLCLAQQLVYYNVGLLPSNFMQVLGDKDKLSMKYLLVKAFLLIFTISVIKSTVTAVTGYLHLFWRESITLFLHKLYMSKTNLYYVSNMLSNKIDNADQRLTQDVDRFCLELSDTSAKLVISPLIIVYYSYQCFSTSGALGPLMIYGYFIVGTLINKFIMSFIVNLVYIQEKREGDFRFKHVQIRNFTESICLIDSEDHELLKLNYFLRLLLAAQKLIVNSEIFLNISTNLIDYTGSILSYIIVSLPIFAGEYDNFTSVELSSVISKNAFVSMYLIQCFSALIDLSSKFTDISGYTHRIGELIEALTQSTTHKDSDDDLESDDDTKDIIADPDILCKIIELSYDSPSSEKILVKNLNIDIKRNHNLLITGKTGSGKSSLLRILKKLWEPYYGRFKFFLSDNEKVMFLPQVPVLTNGSLLDQVVYPLLKTEFGDYADVVNRATKALEDVGLLLLIERTHNIDLDPEWDWSKQLSPGEIQRISFARIYFHLPKLIFLDEATSALGVSEEDCFYRYCGMLNITVVSVGHRPSLRTFHHSCLKIKGDGSWECFDIIH